MDNFLAGGAWLKGEWGEYVGTILMELTEAYDRIYMNVYHVRYW